MYVPVVLTDWIVAVTTDTMIKTMSLRVNCIEYYYLDQGKGHSNNHQVEVSLLRDNVVHIHYTAGLIQHGVCCNPCSSMEYMPLAL